MNYTEAELVAMGYLHPRTFADGHQAALMKFMFTWAIIYDFDNYGYADRWCYHTYQDALTALMAWDGEGEPEGWHRHPRSGRRVHENFCERAY